MSAILSSSHPKFAWPGIFGLFGRSYDQHPKEWVDLYDQATSEKKYEELVQVTPFGLVPVQPEGGTVTYDTETQGPVTRAVHLGYGLGYIVSHNELVDNQYMEVSTGRAPALATAFAQTKERVGANLFNFAFATTGHNGGDGVSMCSTAHPNTSGGVYSNTAAIPAQLSQASLQDMLIQIMQAQDDKGNNINLMGNTLHVSPTEYFNAAVILRTAKETSTANNDINPINTLGLLPGGCKVNHYFTAARPWFIRTTGVGKNRGLIHFQREALEFRQDNDFGTRNARSAGYERYSFIWNDPRCVYGNNAS